MIKYLEKLAKGSGGILIEYFNKTNKEVGLVIATCQTGFPIPKQC